MKNPSLILSLLLLVFLSSCSSTSLLVSWNEKSSPPKNYRKMAVVVMAPDVSKRASVESAVADQLKAKGFNAHATFNTFPFAGKIGDLGLDKETVEEKIKQRINDNGFDGVLTIVLLDAKKEQRYVEGTSISLAAPVYQYPYYGYYSYAYATVYDGGYYTTSTSYFLESNLYDVASGKLIWTAQTKTEDPSSIDKEAVNFSRIIVDDLLTKKVITPESN
jgi:hypothetical protein